MTADAVLKIGRTQTGHVIRLEGKASCMESPALKSLADYLLDTDASGDLVIDLSGGEYPDSTFLGCLIGLHRRFNDGHQPRVYLSSVSASCRASLSDSHLDQLLPTMDASPPILGEWAVLDKLLLPPKALGQHILDAHRLLMDANETNQRTFAPIVARLTRELSSQ